MKLLLLTLLCIYAECRPDAPPSPGAGLKEKLSEYIDKALKRKYGDEFGGTEDDACAKACVQAPPQGMGAIIAQFKEPKLENIKNFYNKELLTKVCTFARTTAECVRACPETQRRAYLRDIFAPIKYMCEDSHFVDHADCYKEVYDSEHERCTTDAHCGGKKTDFLAKYNTYKDAETKTKPDIEAMVGSFCTLIDCAIDCGKAKRIEKCTAEGQTELVTFYQKLAAAMKDTRYLSPRDFVIDVPETCTKIGVD